MAEPNDITLRRALWERDSEVLRRLRETVFVREQQVPAEIEWDGRDVHAEHVIASLGSRDVGCGRLMPDGKIGRMAVLADLRGRGIGARILGALIERAMRQGLPRVRLHAQAHAEGFYARAGFRVEGAPFDEAGIAHVAMVRVLDYRGCPVDVVPVSAPDPFADLALGLVDGARRQLDILSPSLDVAVFARPSLSEAMTALVRGSRDARIRLLVNDAQALLASGHPLLALSRRLPSRIGLRHLPEHPQWDGYTAVISDRKALLRLPAGSSDQGVYRVEDRAAGRRAAEAFEELWRSATQHPGFRALHL